MSTIEKKLKVMFENIITLRATVVEHHKEAKQQKDFDKALNKAIANERDMAMRQLQNEIGMVKAEELKRTTTRTEQDTLREKKILALEGQIEVMQRKSEEAVEKLATCESEAKAEAAAKVGAPPAEISDGQTPCALPCS